MSVQSSGPSPQQGQILLPIRVLFFVDALFQFCCLVLCFSAHILAEAICYPQARNYESNCQKFHTNRKLPSLGTIRDKGFP